MEVKKPASCDLAPRQMGGAAAEGRVGLVSRAWLQQGQRGRVRYRHKAVAAASVQQPTGCTPDALLTAERENEPVVV
jgi:hypothetical protein